MSSLLIPLLRPLSLRSPFIRFLYAQFYDPLRSAPPALFPTVVPFCVPEEVKGEVMRGMGMGVRYNWPFGLKRGATISHAQIKNHLPATHNLYKSLATKIGDIVGHKVQCTKDDDLSSCSVLVYEGKGDHIWWHYDSNFYAGRHYTVLLPISVKDSDTLYEFREWKTDKIVGLKLEEGQMMAFEGDKVYHRATPQSQGLRVVLSMTFSDDPTPRSSGAEPARRFKDIAYFGLDAVGLGKLERAVFGGKGGAVAQSKSV